jgi:hypothetical protein
MKENAFEMFLNSRNNALVLNRQAQKCGRV